MSNFVFVIDSDRTPLKPTHPAKARKLLDAGLAAVYRRYPFTIILSRKIEDVNPNKLSLKIDPGAKTTGISLLSNNLVIWAAELTHRGEQIKLRLQDRRAVRRNRRSRKTRYRKPRFLNKARSPGWLPPSLDHRVLTTITWTKRLIKFCPIGSIAQELVKFDTQKLVDPEISGVQYQQGTLYQYEVRQYLLEKFNLTCVYCGKTNVLLEVEHIVPRSRGGNNRVSNLCIACVPCNQAKSNQDIKDFLAEKPSLLKKILAQAKVPLKDAAAVNSTRWKLFNSLKQIGLPVTTGTGGQTKFNRTQQGLAKTHWLDSACVGETPQLKVLTNQPLLITCKGHCNRQVIQMDKYGFPRKGYKPKQKVLNWNTGDIVSVIAGKNAGLRNIRIKTVRSKGNFEVRRPDKTIASVSRNHIIPVHRKDGYSYSFAEL
ncbi:MAG: RNA-guided endonuclease IscB [Xenococcaceae cyanobacterium MO_167.B27]|nr:RNA-guided endonuclease IscB [Xenococcaceae cyanobacterium MO_167.B27]